jgi:hypothetical protein
VEYGLIDKVIKEWQAILIFKNMMTNRYL